ncbi:hypothetical protein J42TS3_26350 [Paenibacillus vini]|uniref:Uncharacterized protein n=1 Tax=Paenibacillus vini TaxID=1476024 RepID=A0ABQ4MCA0_9BACL|nr:hypothetical protein J42TS3_26350 [Paenibacillus vini]
MKGKQSDPVGIETCTVKFKATRSYITGLLNSEDLAAVRLIYIFVDYYEIVD